jgi:hypothetical protein
MFGGKVWAEAAWPIGRLAEMAISPDRSFFMTAIPSLKIGQRRYFPTWNGYWPRFPTEAYSLNVPAMRFVTGLALAIEPE